MKVISKEEAVRRTRTQAINLLHGRYAKTNGNHPRAEASAYRDVCWGCYWKNTNQKDCWTHDKPLCPNMIACKDLRREGVPVAVCSISRSNPEVLVAYIDWADGYLGDTK